MPWCWKVKTHTHAGPPPVHILCAWSVKICKASLPSKQKLQGNIGQLSELKCIPGDMSFFLFFWLSSPHLFTVLTREIGFSLKFSSNYTSLFWPDAGTSHSNMDKHLWLFSFGKLKTAEVKCFCHTAGPLFHWLSDKHFDKILVQSRTYNVLTAVCQEWRGEEGRVEERNEFKTKNHYMFVVDTGKLAAKNKK